MNALKARFVNGQIILEEPAEIAEGAELLVFPVVGDMNDEERAELEGALYEAEEDFERGDFEDAREFGLRLLARVELSQALAACDVGDDEPHHLWVRLSDGHHHES